jgi:uncharacterized protein with HEPN domain
MKASFKVRNVAILEKIVDYCDQIGGAVLRFGDSFEIFESDTDYKNALAMCILQIGELTTHLTDDFLSDHRQVPWKEIRNMRNLAAHHYANFNLNIFWDTVKNDIMPLRDYCVQCIKELNKQILENEPQPTNETEELK